MRKILLQLTKKQLGLAEIALAMKLPLNGDTSEYLVDLEQAGFIKKFNSWNFKGGTSKIYKFRIVDNYTRFYLKYIYPKKNKIQSLSDPKNPRTFIHWPVVFGLQFENLVFNNVSILTKLLKIDPNDVENLGPYFQTQSNAKKGVQIDLLIQCKRGILHLCEIKSGALIELSVIDEVKQKNNNLKKPKGFAIINHLICLGQVSNSVIEADFFDKIITGDKLLDFEEG